MSTEKTTEKYLVEEVAKLDGRAYKFVSPGHVGVPDRLCVFPKGVTAFVECKDVGKTLTPPQEREKEWLKYRDHIYFMVTSKWDVNMFIKLITMLFEAKE